MLLKIKFLPKYVHFNGLKLSGVLKKSSITLQFLVQECKIQIFEENNVFFSNEVQVISNLSNVLEKTLNP